MKGRRMGNLAWVAWVVFGAFVGGGSTAVSAREFESLRGFLVEGFAREIPLELQIPQDPTACEDTEAGDVTLRSCVLEGARLVTGEGRERVVQIDRVLTYEIPEDVNRWQVYTYSGRMTLRLGDVSSVEAISLRLTRSLTLSGDDYQGTLYFRGDEHHRFLVRAKRIHDR